MSFAKANFTRVNDYARRTAPQIAIQTVRIGREIGQTAPGTENSGEATTRRQARAVGRRRDWAL